MSCEQPGESVLISPILQTNVINRRIRPDLVALNKHQNISGLPLLPDPTPQENQASP